MGYYTSYYLQIKATDGKSVFEIDPKVEKRMIKIINKECDECFDEGGWQESTWYDWVEDLEKISVKYPAFVFFLEGRGDEWNDHWEAIFWNGKSRQEYYESTCIDLTLDMLQDGYEDPPKEIPLLTINLHNIEEAINTAELEIPENFKLSDDICKEIAEKAWASCIDNGFWESFSNDLNHAAVNVLEKHFREIPNSEMEVSK